MDVLDIALGEPEMRTESDLPGGVVDLDEFPEFWGTTSKPIQPEVDASFLKSKEDAEILRKRRLAERDAKERETRMAQKSLFIARKLEARKMKRREGGEAWRSRPDSSPRRKAWLDLPFERQEQRNETLSDHSSDQSGESYDSSSETSSSASISEDEQDFARNLDYGGRVHGVDSSNLHPLAQWAFRRTIQKSTIVPPPNNSPLSTSLREADVAASKAASKVLVDSILKDGDLSTSAETSTALPPWLQAAATSSKYRFVPEQGTSISNRMTGQQSSPDSINSTTTTTLKKERHQGAILTSSALLAKTYTRRHPTNNPHAISVSPLKTESWKIGARKTSMRVDGSPAHRPASERVAELSRQRGEPSHWTTWRRMHAASLAEEVAAAARRREVAKEEQKWSAEAEFAQEFDLVRHEMEEWWRKEEEAASRRKRRVKEDEEWKEQLEREQMADEDEKSFRIETWVQEVRRKHDLSAAGRERTQMSREDKRARILHQMERAQQWSERRMMFLEDEEASTVHRIEVMERRRLQSAREQMRREDIFATQLRFDLFANKIIAGKEQVRMEDEDAASARREAAERGAQGLRRLYIRRRFWNHWYRQQYAALSLQRSWRARRITRGFLELMHHARRNMAARAFQAAWRGMHSRWKGAAARARALGKISKFIRRLRMFQRLRRIVNAVLFVRNVVRMQRRFRLRSRGIGQRLRRLLDFPQLASIDDMFTALDANRDDRVTAAEFVQSCMAVARRHRTTASASAAYTASSKSPRRASTVEIPSFSQLMSLFHAIDQGGRGVVTRSQFHAAFQASPAIPSLPADSLSRSHSWIDADGRRISSRQSSVSPESPAERRMAQTRILDLALHGPPRLSRPTLFRHRGKGGSKKKKRKQRHNTEK